MFISSENVTGGSPSGLAFERLEGPQQRGRPERRCADQHRIEEIRLARPSDRACRIDRRPPDNAHAARAQPANGDLEAGAQ